MSVKQIVLDHGYVELIETWGSDERIIEAARMSTGKGFERWDEGDICKGCGSLPENPLWEFRRFCPILPGSSLPQEHVWKHVSGDAKLLRFLFEHGHMTPFEMAGAIFEVKAPIFVFREWHRHRTQSYNEMSARYTPLPDENYRPTTDRLLINAGGSNRQAGTIAGSDELTLDSSLEWLLELDGVYEHAERVYQSGLRRGVPKELARLPIPVARYSRMRAAANLRNWLGFDTLRTTLKNPAAQWEIRQFADAQMALLAGEFPRSLALFGGKD